MTDNYSQTRLLTTVMLGLVENLLVSLLENFHLSAAYISAPAFAFCFNQLNFVFSGWDGSVAPLAARTGWDSYIFAALHDSK